MRPEIGRCSPTGASGRDHRLDGKSRMRRESHVRFRESVGVRFPRATRPTTPSAVSHSGALRRTSSPHSVDYSIAHIHPNIGHSHAGLPPYPALHAAADPRALPPARRVPESCSAASNPAGRSHPLVLVRLARNTCHRSTRNPPRMATPQVPRVLDEVDSIGRARAARDPKRGARSDPPHVGGQPSVGSASDRRGSRQDRY